DHEHLVFPSRSGTPLLVENLRRRVLRPAAVKAGAPWAGFHTFRHTCASLLFERGANAVQVQRWLGHHSAAFTLARYIHLLGHDPGEPLSLEQELGGTRIGTTRQYKPAQGAVPAVPAVLPLQAELAMQREPAQAA